MADNFDNPLAPLFKRYEALATHRANWEHHWQQVADYIHPDRTDFTVRNVAGGHKRRVKVFDSTGIEANQRLAAALQGMLTPPSEPWFELRSSLAGLSDSEKVREWLTSVRDIMLEQINLPNANFHGQCHELYSDEGSFGTAVMFIGDGESNKRPLHFKAISLSECTIAENDWGVVDTLFRKYKMTLRQAAQMFGEENLSDDLRQKLKDGKYDNEAEFLNAVIPTAEDDTTRQQVGHKWTSIHAEVRTKHEVARRGFHEFPYVVPRWSKLTGEMYGRGPGMAALPDVMMLNEMAKTTIKAAQKVVDPPLQAPDDGFLGPLRTLPASVNYYRAGSNDRIEPLATGANVPIGLELLERVQDRIRSIFFNDLLELPDRPKSHQEMREQEVIARREDQRVLLTPVLVRFQHEFFGPLIRRIYGILDRRGLFPPVPRELSDAKLTIEYMSPIVRALKGLQAQSFQGLLQQAAALGQIDPAVFDNLDTDETFRWLAATNNLPVKLLRQREDVVDVRERRQQENAQQQALMQAESVSGSLKDVAQAQSAVQ